MPSGESQYLGEVRQTGSVQVPEASIHYQIRTFILNYRTVSTDYQIVYSNIDDCFAMVTQNYTPIFRQELLDNSPFSLVGKIRRSVEIESILLITGRSYNVNWTESSYDASANHTTAKMRAVVTIRLATPTDASIKRNPLGIYIESFEMTEL
jgi:type IV secretion system protein VirB5